MQSTAKAAGACKPAEMMSSLRIQVRACALQRRGDAFHACELHYHAWVAGREEPQHGRKSGLPGLVAWDKVWLLTRARDEVSEVRMDPWRCIAGRLREASASVTRKLAGCLLLYGANRPSATDCQSAVLKVAAETEKR